MVYLWERVKPVTLIDLLIPECCRGRGVGFGEVGCGSCLYHYHSSFQAVPDSENGDSVCLMGLLEGSESRPDALVMPSVSPLTPPPHSPELHLDSMGLQAL